MYSRWGKEKEALLYQVQALNIHHSHVIYENEDSEEIPFEVYTRIRMAQNPFAATRVVTFKGQLRMQVQATLDGTHPSGPTQQDISRYQSVGRLLPVQYALEQLVPDVRIRSASQNDDKHDEKNEHVKEISCRKEAVQKMKDMTLSSELQERIAKITRPLSLHCSDVVPTIILHAYADLVHHVESIHNLKNKAHKDEYIVKLQEKVKELPEGEMRMVAHTMLKLMPDSV